MALHSKLLIVYYKYVYEPTNENKRKYLIEKMLNKIPSIPPVYLQEYCLTHKKKEAIDEIMRRIEHTSLRTR